MFLTSWLRRKAPRPRPTAARVRPQLESLGDRIVPSTLKVTNLGDQGHGSLRYEISAAKSGDTIVFDKQLDGGTITLVSGELVISKSLTINGDGQLLIATSPWLDGFHNVHNGSRIFEVDGAGTTVAIGGLTLTKGGGTRYGNGVTGYPYDGYGGAILNFGKLTLSNCRVGTGNTSYGSNAQYGGAIANFGTMAVSGGAVNANSASAFVGASPSGEGGGIYNAGTMTVSGGCYVEFNSASAGGGIYNAGSLTVSNSYFALNTPDDIFGPYVDGGGNTFH